MLQRCSLLDEDASFGDVPRTLFSRKRRNEKRVLKSGRHLHRFRDLHVEKMLKFVLRLGFN